MTSNQRTVVVAGLIFLLGLIALLFFASLPALERGDSGLAVAAAVLLGSLIISAAILISRK